ncbi:MAG: transcriptional repressor [Magnetococcales bacterium]|nr:transcriptional repressor [Magnetococcales bacterium]
MSTDAIPADAIPADAILADAISADAMPADFTPKSAHFPESEHDHQHCQSWILQRAEERCRQQGMRFTPQRREVLNILATSHRSMGAYDILGQMQTGQSRRPPPAAVYRCLEFLLAQGLIHRMAGRNAYFACTREGHDQEIQFWICRHCGVVGETESSILAAELRNLAGTLDFVVRSANVEIEGECRACRTA